MEIVGQVGLCRNYDTVVGHRDTCEGVATQVGQFRWQEPTVRWAAIDDQALCVTGLGNCEHAEGADVRSGVDTGAEIARAIRMQTTRRRQSMTVERRHTCVDKSGHDLAVLAIFHTLTRVGSARDCFTEKRIIEDQQVRVCIPRGTELAAATWQRDAIGRQQFWASHGRRTWTTRIAHVPCETD